MFKTVVAACALMLATDASAATYVVTYQGTVINSENKTNEFGTVGSLDGLAFTATYTLTLPHPGAIYYGSAFETGFYGTDYMNARLAINGITQSFTGHLAYIDLLNGSGSPEIDSVQHMIIDSIGFQDSDYLNGHANAIENGIWSYLTNFVKTVDVTTTMYYSAQNGDSGFGQFQIHETTDYGSTITRWTDGYFRTTSVSIAAIAEPKTWAMLIAGFAMAGASMRRRKATVQFA